MKMRITAAAFCALALAQFGCTSPQKPKPIHERAWVGGQFENVPVPRHVRPKASIFARNAPLLVHLTESSPLQKAGLRPGDLILAVDGKNVRNPREVRQALDARGAQPSAFLVYREGQLLEKTVTPGAERYQQIGILTFGLGLSSHISLDLFPNPDFSLGALGFEHEHDRLNLADPKSQYLRHLAALDSAPGQTNQPPPAPASSLRSDEGWKFWLGPLTLERRKSILSQQ